jgi:radical SAM protein with 4Fe4S-binding SPASM domain
MGNLINHHMVSTSTFGNVNEVKLEDIWQSSEYKSLQKNYFNHELCKTCNMRKPLIS